MLYIASDHGGFPLKEKLVKWLVKEYGDRVEDLGPSKLNPNDDYPKYSALVAQAVAGYGVRATGQNNKAPNSPTRNSRVRQSLGESGQLATDLGILLCRSGQGMCIVANKFKGVRAVLAWNEKTAKASRHDDHANVLCLPSDYISFALAQKIVRAWLQTPFGKEARHKRRVKEIEKLETLVHQN